MTEPEALAHRILKTALRHGAEHADVFVQRNARFSVTVRDEIIENLSQAETQGVGVRVFSSGRLGFACANDFSDKALENIAVRAVKLAAVSSPDPANGLPNGSATPSHVPELFDPEVERVSAEHRIDMARRGEVAMFAADERIVNSEGCTCSTNITRVTLVNSNGANVLFETSDCALICVPIAASGDEMQVAFDYTAGRFLEDLGSPEALGKRAAQMAVRKLGGKKPATRQAPILLERRVASQLVGALFAAVDGESVQLRMSFLHNHLGQKIASPLLTIFDDGTKPRALGSAVCDDEGVPTQRTSVIREGMLEAFLYDVRTARAAGAEPTGNGQRGYESLPRIAPTNFFVEPGAQSPADMISSIRDGFYVTDVMGGGLDPVSGDVSWGASGIWIENGELTYPVQEVTISGHTFEVLNRLEAIGNDLVFDSTAASPTLLIGRMTISGG